MVCDIIMAIFFVWQMLCQAVADVAAPVFNCIWQVLCQGVVDGMVTVV